MVLLKADVIEIKAIYHSKKRDHTTVVFKDGHSITVKRMKGEKDSVDTAVAYALAKNLYNLKDVMKIVKEV